LRFNRSIRQLGQLGGQSTWPVLLRPITDPASETGLHGRHAALLAINAVIQFGQTNLQTHKIRCPSAASAIRRLRTAQQPTV
jgi:hypothetical protein